MTFTKSNFKFSGLFAILIVLALFACRNNQSALNKNPEIKTQEQKNTKQVLPDSIYRFTISFFSIGSGIDRNAAQNFNSFLENFEKVNNVKLQFETARWGREGETDYCFKLSELNLKQEEKFIADTKEILKSSTRIRFHENVTCRHK